MPRHSLTHQQRQYSTTRRATLALVTAGVTLLTAAACGGHRGGTGGQQPGQQPGTSPAVSSPAPVPAGSPSPAGTATRAGTWSQLPRAPLQGSTYQAVWTGREMLLYQPNLAVPANGGAVSGTVGAAYNPATGTWRRLPTSGLPVRSIEGGYPAVWDGTEMLTWGMHNGAYNPTTNRWRPLGEPAIYGASVVVWTGRQVLMWGGGCCAEFLANGAAYTPATNGWQPLPASPLSGRHTTGVWTGRELVIAGGYNEDQGTLADAAAYNPGTRTWRKLPPMPAPRSDGTAVWTGTEVVVVGGTATNQPAAYADAVAYNPTTNRWRALPSMGGSRVGHVSVWTGRQVLVWGGQTILTPATIRSGPVYRTPAHGMAYDPATNRWTPLPAAPLTARRDAEAVWTGRAMLVWGGAGLGATTTFYANGASYRPA